MNREQVLETAAALTTRDREDTYGPPKENFEKIAAGWQVIFGCPVEPWQVALAMDWVKSARLTGNPTHTDSWIDKAGYSALGAEVSE